MDKSPPDEQICHQARANYNLVPGKLMLTNTALKWEGLEGPDGSHSTPISNIRNANFLKAKEDADECAMLEIKLRYALTHKKNSRYYRFVEGRNYIAECEQFCELINKRTEYFSLDETSRLKITLLQENPELAYIYNQFIINSQLLDENEFWEAADKYKEAEKQLFQKVALEPGLANSFLRFSAATSQKEVELTFEDVRAVLRLYPEVAEKNKEKEGSADGYNIGRSFLGFMEEQQTGQTEIVGGHEDIKIEEGYRRFTPRPKIPQKVRQMFGGSYMPMLGPAKLGYGTYRSRAEAEMSLSEDFNPMEDKIDEEDMEIEKLKVGLINQINRHAKRVICTIVGTSLCQDLVNCDVPKLPQNEPSSATKSAVKAAPSGKVDTDSSRDSATKLLASINGLKAAKGLQNYVVKQENAEATFEAVNGLAGKACSALEEASPSKNLQPQSHCRESHTLLKLFYKQIPLVSRQRKENLERIVAAIQRFITSLGPFVNRDPKASSTYRQMIDLMRRALDFFAKVTRPTTAMH